MAAGDVVLTPTGSRYVIDLISAGAADPPGNRRVPGDILKPIGIPVTGVGESTTWGQVKNLVRS